MFPSVAKEYALDALHRVRAALVRKKARDLADAMHLVAEVQNVANERQHAVDEFDRRSRDIQRDEKRRADEGGLSANDLAQAARWAEGREFERAAHAERLVEAERALREARTVAEREREILARARTEAEILERDRAHWEHQQVMQRWTAEDEEAFENHQSRSCVKVRK